MSKWDREYLKLCKRILKEGKEVENRTGVNTIKVPSHHFHFDLGEEFPCLTTKKLYFRQAILEMLWIYQAQSNDVRWLQDRDVNIWNQWKIDVDGIYRTYYPNSDEIEDKDRIVAVRDTDGNLLYSYYGGYLLTAGATDEMREKGMVLREAKMFGEEYAHTIGTAYGYIVRRFGLIDNLIYKLQNNPNDRRMVMSLWQDDYLKTAVLPSCVWSSEWDVTDGKLNAWVHQRSCDVPLGLPFNVTQYSVLLNMLAQVTNLKPGTLDWSIKDAHIYVNQINGIKTQIERYETLGDYKAPELWLNPEVNNFYDFDSSKECRDVKVLKYKNHGPIKFDLTQ